MSMLTIGESPYLHGLHEPGGEHLMSIRPGWIVFTHELGHDPHAMSGIDYRKWSDAGFGIIARLNHGYGAAGTIPLPQYYLDFTLRVGNFVAHSPGCSTWIIGNETNHFVERPEGQIITPDSYAACFLSCRDAILAQPGHSLDQIIPAPAAPWYPPEPIGYIDYFKMVLLLCKPNAIAIHTYSRGPDPLSITDTAHMGPPYEKYYNGFLSYRDFMNAIPGKFRGLPVYITETDQYGPWVDTNSGWVRAAYAEINHWNSFTLNQKIHCLCLYRWPKYDQWYIEGKHGVEEDFRMAAEIGYRWKEETIVASIPCPHCGGLIRLEKA